MAHWRIASLVSGFATALRSLPVAALALIIAVAGPAAAVDRAHISVAQQQLTALGFDTGGTAGSLGPRTRSAIKAFQAKLGVAATGRLDAGTRQLIDTQARRLLTANSTAATDASGSAQPSTDSSPAPDDSGTGWSVIVLAVIAFFVWRAIRSGGKPARPAASNTARPVQASVRLTSNLASPKTVSRQLSHAERAAQAERCWVPGGRPVTIAGQLVSSGLLYVGDGLGRADGYGVENCLINPSLAVATAEPNDTGANVPYWPSYSFLEPHARLSYLGWLANGKSDPGIYVGYVFIYFYGLERRLMLDDAGPEAPAIVQEVKRLLGIYHDNHSFQRYASELLTAASLKYGLPIDWPPPALRKSNWQLPLALRVCVGRAIAAGQPLTPDQVLTWYNSHPDKRLPPMAARCEDEFRALFATKFAAKFPSGLKVVAPKRKLSADYHAASSSFTVAIARGSELPDIAALTAPLNQIDSLIEECASELAAYARLSGKEPSKRNQLAAAAALPEALRSSSSGQAIGLLKAWLADRTQGRVAYVELAQLLARAGIDQPDSDRVTKTDLNFVADALAACGFGLEPDPKLTYPIPALHDEVVVFRTEQPGRNDAARAEFLAAVAHTDIGMLVATSDGRVSPEQFNALQATITQNAALGSSEQRRLLARLAFLSKNPPTVRALSRFKDRPLADREAVARLARSVATADGQVAVETVRVLERIYKSLDLPASRLYSDLQRSSGSDEQLPTVEAADPIKSVPIPPRPDATSVQLNAARLAKTRAETAIVGSILGEIFRDDEPSEVGAPSAGPEVSAPATVDALPGLDSKYRPLVTALAGLGQISRADFDKLASEHGLLSDGAIETINDWAFARFDRPLLEDDDPMSISADLLTVPDRVAA